MRIPTILVVVLAAASPAAASTVRHVPPAEATPGQSLELRAEVVRAWESTLMVHFRPIGAGIWQAAEFRRDGDQWVAAIPAAVMRPPGVEYFIDAEAGGTLYAEFASQTAPHTVSIRPGEAEVRSVRELATRAGHRSRISAAYDWVDFGSREVMVGGESLTLRDRYYRLDADWSYLALKYPLKAFRIGYSRLLGTTPDDVSLDGGVPCGDCEVRAGYKVGGFFELRFAFVEGVELDTRAAVMATSEGASPGGRAELRVGVEDGSHMALGGELMADVGSCAYFRLGWATVPGLPMAATVEATSYPFDDRDRAVRLLYDIAHPFRNGLRVGARLGYQARDERVGGVTLGLRTAVDF